MRVPINRYAPHSDLITVLLSCSNKRSVSLYSSWFKEWEQAWWQSESKQLLSLLLIALYVVLIILSSDIQCVNI